jgi:hypothetical protein
LLAGGPSGCVLQRAPLSFDLSSLQADMQKLYNAASLPKLLGTTEIEKLEQERSWISRYTCCVLFLFGTGS